MKVAILCVCSVAIGFVAGRNRPTSPPETIGVDAITTSSSTESDRKISSPKPSLNNFSAEFQRIKSAPARHFNFRLLDLARSVPLENAAVLLQAARQCMSLQEFRGFSDELISRWAVADPLAVISYAESLPENASERDGALSSGLLEWAHVAPDDAIGYVERLPRRERLEHLQTILPGVAANDPERALSLLTNMPVTQRYSAKSQILDAIAQTNPQRAIQFCEQHQKDPVFGRDERLLEGPLRTWIEKDASAAAAWFAAQPESFQKRHVEEAARALQGIAENDPALAARMIAQLPIPANNAYSFGYVISTWCERAPEQCKAWLDAQDNRTLKDAGVAAYAAYLAKDDAKAAVEMLSAVSNPSANEGYVHSIFAALAEQDPQEALARSEKLEVGLAQSSALAGAISGWANVSPREAAEYALRLPENDYAAGSVQDVIVNYLLDDPAASVEWLQKFSTNSTARNAAIQRAVQEYSHASPEIAAQFAALLPAGEFAQQFTNFGQLWARANPEEAIALASSLPEEPSRAAALAGALGAWAESEPTQAANFLQHLSGDELTQSAKAVVRVMGMESPATTAQWLQNFPQALLEEILPEFLPNWISSDLAAATTWINRLPAGQVRDLAIAIENQ